MFVLALAPLASAETVRLRGRIAKVEPPFYYPLKVIEIPALPYPQPGVQAFSIPPIPPMSIAPQPPACRSQCHTQYYFCSINLDPGECSIKWAPCLSRCTSSPQASR